MFYSNVLSLFMRLLLIVLFVLFVISSSYLLGNPPVALVILECVLLLCFSGIYASFVDCIVCIVCDK